MGPTLIELFLANIDNKDTSAGAEAKCDVTEKLTHSLELPFGCVLGVFHMYERHHSEMKWVNFFCNLY